MKRKIIATVLPIECHISVCLESLGNIFITLADRIVINGQEAKRTGGWTLKKIIECAAFEIEDTVGSGYSYGSWHSHIFLEAFEKVGDNSFRVAFGS